MIMLQRIVYFSRNRMTGDSAAMRKEVETILDAARRNNRAAGLTGALIFNSGGFAQVLEGERDALAATFERIQCDPRHSDVLVLEYCEADRRYFDHWSMAFVGVNQDDQRLFGAISKESGFDHSHFSATDVLQAMHRLVSEEEPVRARA